MVSSILGGRANIEVSGNAAATSKQSNFIIQGNPQDVVNYARKGNDLIVQMDNGQIHTIRNFSAQGWDFHKLIFVQGEKSALVDLAGAVSAAGDGIVESLVTVQAVGAGASTSALLGILGAAGAGVGAVAAGADEDEASVDPTDPTDPVYPTYPPVPDQPEILRVENESHDTIAEGNPTNDSAPTFYGTNGVVGSIIELRDADGILLGSDTVGAEGTWIITPSTALPEGSNALRFIQIDAEQNESDPLEYIVVVDLTNPAPPSDFAVSNDAGVSASDGHTSDNTLIFSGTTEADASIELFIGGTSIGTATADADGLWSYDYTGTPLLDGTYSITAIATDTAGNASATSSPFSLTIDTQVPNTPVIIQMSSDTGTPSDNITADSTLIFSGTADSNVVIEIFIDGVSAGTTTADGVGVWTFDHSGTSLADGTYSVTAVATDTAGNASSASTALEVVVDRSAATPTITAISDDTGLSASDGSTSDNTLVISGSAEADAIVEVFIDNVSIGSVTADSSGNWSYDHTGVPLSDGTYAISASAVDVAGNSSARSASFTVVVDSAVPTVTIDGNGSTGTITFTFSTAIDPASFSEADITIANGAIVSGSLSTTDNIVWTVGVTPDAGAGTNVSITLAAGAVQALSGANNQLGANVTSLNELFRNSTPLGADAAGMDTSHATSATSTFQSNTLFNDDISGWDVANVTNMQSMFESATTFDQDIGGWNVGNVTNMSSMFRQADSFNQDIGDWNVGNVTNMNSMFMSVDIFNQDIGGWNVTNVTNMQNMFQSAAVFNQDIGGWNVGNVVNMQNMFNAAAAFNQDIGGWDVSNVTSMSSMFRSAAAFNQDIGGWDVSNVLSMSYMFKDATAFNQDIGGWNVGHVSTTEYMFDSAATFNQDISGWNVENVTNMASMFRSASAFNQDIGGWDVSDVTSMRGMFQSAVAFDQNIGGWDVGNVTKMDYMFYGTSAFNQDIGGWDVSKVDNMTGMFTDSNFNQSLANWDISSLMSAQDMFRGSNMSVENMDATLRGWARLDTAAGETAILTDVIIDLADYSDATAAQYLIDHYYWTFSSGNLISVVGSDTMHDTLNQSSSLLGQSIHGLGGNDIITGSSHDDWIVGGTGSDTLTGGAGSDTFDFSFEDAGNDTILDFTTGLLGDAIRISDLLIGYQHGVSNLSAFVSAADNGSGGSMITIDHDGAGPDTSLVRINLASVSYNPTLLDDMIANGNLIVA